MRVEDLSTYEIIEKREIPDINSVTYLCRHKKTGARVALVSNDDENKVFSLVSVPPRRIPPAWHISWSTLYYAARRNSR